jgi:outer membrane protein assembly factor BamB
VLVLACVIVLAAAGAARSDVLPEDHCAADLHAHGDRVADFAAGDDLGVAAGVRDAGVRFLYFVRACDRASGRILWEDVLPATASSSASDVTVSDGRVFVAGEIGYDWPYAGSDAIVRAYDGRTGALLWQERRGAPGFHEGVSAIEADGGRVFLLGAVWEIGAGAREHAIRAHDAATGAVLWEDRRVMAFDTVVGPAALQVAGRRVYAAGYTRRVGEPGDTLVVRAYEAATGEKLWERQRSEPGEHGSAPGSITVRDGRALASAAGVSRAWRARRDAGSGARTRTARAR